MRLLLPFLALLCAGLLLPTLPLVAQMNEGEHVEDAAVKGNKAMDAVTEDPALPRVLLIGDSISISYTVGTRTLLKGKANVLRIPGNGMDSHNGVTHIPGWLGKGKWDVIHVNFGLWDSKNHGGKPTADPATYEKNLHTIIGLLKATGAKIIWATTTPVPAVLHPATRIFNPPIPAYNDVALKVAKEEGIAVDDLYNVILPVQAKYQNAFDVHYNAEGAGILAAAVAKSIEAELPPVKH